MFLLLSLAAASHAAAQDYPCRTVRVIDPFSPGGGSDVLARIAAQKLTERLGQTFVVENRPGGGGHIGADVVVKSPPNGYTLLLAGVPHAIGMTLYRKLPYDLAKDLAPISQLATFPSLIVVHPSLPVKSVKELLVLAKARPGELNYGAIIARLNAEIGAAMKASDVTERLSSLGAQAAPTSADEFGRITCDEIKKWAKVVKESGAKVE